MTGCRLARCAWIRVVQLVGVPAVRRHFACGELAGLDNPPKRRQITCSGEPTPHANDGNGFSGVDRANGSSKRDGGGGESGRGGEVSRQPFDRWIIIHTEGESNRAIVPVAHN
jgi:hypothetical protein